MATYPIATMCRVLGVATSGYYAWLKRKASVCARADKALTVRIRAIHARSRGTYGAPRIHAELAHSGIRYIPTWTGFLYLAVVVDVWSRRVVGWAMATHLRTQLVLDALSMAIGQRRPLDVVHHSDQSSQYTSVAFGLRCRAAGVRPSMGSVGDCYDNALCESFFATLECELIERHRFRNPAEARMAVFDFIEGWYNPHRRHSALEYLSPINYELEHQKTK